MSSALLFIFVIKDKCASFSLQDYVLPYHCDKF